MDGRVMALEDATDLGRSHVLVLEVPDDVTLGGDDDRQTLLREDVSQRHAVLTGELFNFLEAAFGRGHNRSPPAGAKLSPTFKVFFKST